MKEVLIDVDKVSILINSLLVWDDMIKSIIRKDNVSLIEYNVCAADFNRSNDELTMILGKKAVDNYTILA